MNKLLIGLALMTLSAHAAVDVAVTPGDWPLYRGSTIVPPRHATLEACVAAIKALNAPRTYTCRTTVTVVATTAVPPPIEAWTRCAGENELCTYTGIRRVRYGADPNWSERNQAAVSGGIQCSNAVFGDPIFGVEKRCEIAGTTTPAAGTATLRWVAPTRNTDNSALADLAGYTITYQRDNDVAQTVTVGPTETSRVIGGLSSGTWQFSIVAFNSAGVASAPAGPATKVIP